MRDGAAGEAASPAAERRVIGIACAAHALHDGYADALYVLLPLWRAEWGLGYAVVGMLRALYSAAMATFQRPSAALAERLGGRVVLTIGTVIVGVGYLAGGASSVLGALGIALLAGGL